MDESASRVFVSGLPPTLTDAELRKHFSSKFAVTDAHIIPKRRIGFVGFTNQKQAQDAVAYFNKTYIRMSRISAEIARPIAMDVNGAGEARPMSQRYTVNLDHQKSQDSVTGTPGNLKRKRDAREEPEDSKFKEFVGAMRSVSNKDRWASADLPSLTVSPAEPVVQSHPDRTLPQHDNLKHSVPAAEFSHPGAIRHVESASDGKRSPAEDGQSTDAQTVPLTDDDWLRTKTSRLLGLIDDEDEAIDQVRGPVAPDTTEHLPSISQEELSEADSLAAGDQIQLAPDEADRNKAAIQRNGRLFIRNLAYSIQDNDIEELFGSYGNLEEVHVATDTRTNTSKGYAYVQFLEVEAAVRAYEALDGKVFKGRLLHIMPASSRQTHKLDEYDLSKLPLKQQNQIRRRHEAATSTFKWNSLFMNPDAVMASIADRLGVSKADILDPTSSEAAVKQAHAETHIIQETQDYFAKHGVILEAFQRKERGDRAILAKNFTYSVKESDLRKLFETHGEITRFLIPPSGTIAIVEFAEAAQARDAFKSLAYRKFGDSILFLEKAPKDLFSKDDVVVKTVIPEEKPLPLASDVLGASESTDKFESPTLFVRNLNFETTSARLTETFKPLEGFLSARVKTKTDPKRPGQTLSMGFGFVEFATKSQAQAALEAMNGYRLDNHQLLVRPSHKGGDAAEERRREDNAKKVASRKTKIIIKNLPFEATRKDLQSLFGAYGQLRSVRLPKKFDRSTRGFAFADFMTAREAESAMEALRNTHLLGRRLVLDFAAEEATDPEEEIRKIEKKVGQQMERVRMKELTGSGRRKFNVQTEEDEDV